MNLKSRKSITVVLSVLIFLGIFAATAAQSRHDSLYSYAKLYTDIAFRIKARYVEEVDAKDLVYSGIKGMMDTLDPFSEFLEMKEYDRLMETTKGKYSGLGMTIFQRDGWITVVSPMEGTPAYRMGLRAGDKIIKIDDESTKGMSTEDASKLMRGEAGTTVKLTIQREGILEPLEYVLERAIIELKTVPYYGLARDKIGYIRLARFGTESENELEEAIDDLQQQGMESLILDLRSNGGGLLTQAVKTTSHFLPEDREIVSTKGRTSDQNRSYSTEGNPQLPDMPMVILVNQNSASASEILSGAIQDWDRGVIIGNDTFGKGLVQQIYPLSEKEALKLTTAKWYMPSGRCIQKEERYHRNSFAEDIEGITGMGDDQDSTLAEEDEEEAEIYYTKGGRIVYGGGGVKPDIEVESDELSTLMINLERLSMFFDFSVHYTTLHPELPEDFEVNQSTINEFRKFLKEKDFSYKNTLELELEKLEKTAEEENRLTELNPYFEQLHKKIEELKEKEFEESLPEIKRSIKRDVLSKLYGEKARYEQIILKDDPYIERALEVLTNQQMYVSILKG
ncbi:MAG: PDZ domain-containing protein [candidate division Zixibacteria bacterium]|nr:PDZ domain-containing protein [candidate division Zixibacteria bacterium]